VSESGIKSARVRVRHRGIRRVGISLSTTAEPGPASGEKEHLLFMGRILEAWSAGGQKDDGTCGATAEQTDTGPDVDCICNWIAALSEEYNALALCLLEPINGLLQEFGGIT